MSDPNFKYRHSIILLINDGLCLLLNDGVHLHCRGGTSVHWLGSCNVLNTMILMCQKRRFEFMLRDRLLSKKMNTLHSLGLCLSIKGEVINLVVAITSQMPL